MCRYQVSGMSKKAIKCNFTVLINLKYLQCGTMKGSKTETYFQFSSNSNGLVVKHHIAVCLN
jgi:hypothetical protein